MISLWEWLVPWVGASVLRLETPAVPMSREFRWVNDYPFNQ